MHYMENGCGGTTAKEIVYGRGLWRLDGVEGIWEMETMVLSDLMAEACGKKL